MYNLFRFFLRYYLFLLFLILEVFCFFLIYRNKHYNQVAYINIANSANGKLYQTVRSVTDYIYLRRISDSLVAENASLRARLLESKLDNHVDSLKTTDTTGRFTQHFTYLTARVIRNSVNQSSNLIFLDKGKLHGLAKQMGVVNANGIVGQVISVSDNYAAVMSVLSKDFKVSAKL